MLDVLPCRLGGLTPARAEGIAVMQPARDRRTVVEELYQEHYDFVWRTLRRLGVPASAVDDAAQEVFLAAYHGLDAFAWRSSAKTWLYGIARNMALRHHERAARDEVVEVPESLPDGDGASPADIAADTEELRVLYALLAELDAEKREVFVLAELEGFPANVVGEMIGAKMNTVYSRLRAARAEFEKAAARYRAREAWRAR
jgi:RNA polymerase sigma-70 factor, ECF subfamily